MKILLLILFFVCGCAHDQKGYEKVKIVDLSQLPLTKRCHSLGSIRGVSNGGKSGAAKELKNEAVKLGGNAVISRMYIDKSPGSLFLETRIDGVAIHCPDEIHHNLTSTEDY